MMALHHFRAAAGTIAYAGARRFLARLDARLLEVARLLERLDETLLVEDLLQALETAFNGFAFFQFELNRHVLLFTFLSSRILGAFGKKRTI